MVRTRVHSISVSADNAAQHYTTITMSAPAWCWPVRMHHPLLSPGLTKHGQGAQWGRGTGVKVRPDLDTLELNFCCTFAFRHKGNKGAESAKPSRM